MSSSLLLAVSKRSRTLITQRQKRIVLLRSSHPSSTRNYYGGHIIRQHPLLQASQQLHLRPSTTTSLIGSSSSSSQVDVVRRQFSSSSSSSSSIIQRRIRKSDSTDDRRMISSTIITSSSGRSSSTLANPVDYVSVRSSGDEDAVVITSRRRLSTFPSEPPDDPLQHRLEKKNNSNSAAVANGEENDSSSAILPDNDTDAATTTTTTQDNSNNPQHHDIVSSFAVQRALRLHPDEAWDEVFSPIDAPPDHDHPDDHRSYARPYTAESTTTTTTSNSSSVSPHESNNSKSSMPWEARRWKLLTTESLLLTSVGDWTVEQWIVAEEILQMYLAQTPTIRSVVLQFALFNRTLQEGESLQKYPQQSNGNNNEDHAKHSLSRAEIDKFITSQLLNDLLLNWSLVYHQRPEELAKQLKLDPVSLFDHIVHEYNGRYGAPISQYTFYLLLQADVNLFRAGSSTTDFAKTCLECTVNMWHLGVKGCFPSSGLFNLVLESFMKQANQTSILSEVQEILSRMQELQVPPTVGTWHAAFKIMAKEGTVAAAMEAERLIESMDELYREDQSNVQVDVNSFGMAITAWARSNHPEAGHRAERLFAKMQTLRQEQRLYGDPEREIAVFGTVLQSWGHSRIPDGAQQAERFWRETELPGNVKTYSFLLHCYAREGDLASTERLLLEMRNLGMDPTMEACGSVFSALTKSDVPNRTELAERLMQQIKPNTRLYNMFLKILVGDSKHTSRERAEQVLEEMKDRYKKGEDTRPDVISYSTVVQAWAQTGSPNRARDAFDAMLDDYRLNGNESAKPDRQSFNLLFRTVVASKHVDAPTYALKLFDEMKQMAQDKNLGMSPDVYTYSSVISCFAHTKANKNESATRAQELLEEMKSGKFARPNSFCYNNVMNAWANAGNLDRVEQVFRSMCEDYKNGNEDAVPQTATFNILIKAWAFSGLPTAPKHAEELVQQMDHLASSGGLHVPPDGRTFTTLITCYGLAKLPEKGYNVIRHMDWLYKHGRIGEGPSRRTFEALMRAWKTSDHAHKSEMIASIEKEMRRRFGPSRRTGGKGR